MPMAEEYDDQLKSNFADFANVGGRDGGAITAACFLAKFTDGLRWAHLDIAGTAYLTGAQKGSTGRPVPLLVDFLLNLPLTVACTQVDFYLLGAADPRARLATACRIAEKAFDQGLRVAVRTASPSETAELDELMWTFSDRSFVPHAVWPAEPAVADETPVLIASGAPARLAPRRADQPRHGHAGGCGHFGRICEVVGGDEDAKQRARVRWRGYREAGLSPASHDV